MGWDWAMDAGKVDQSEVFNVDEYSMGSNGMYIAGREDTYLGLQDTTFPPGTGGGRIYSVWQNLDWDEREDAIEGTSTLLNSPPTADMELSDVLSFGLVAEDKTFGDLMDTMSGPYCYRYE